MNVLGLLTMGVSVTYQTPQSFMNLCVHMGTGSMFNASKRF